jgi:hypothetical protein
MMISAVLKQVPAVNRFFYGRGKEVSSLAAIRAAKYWAGPQLMRACGI